MGTRTAADLRAEIERLDALRVQREEAEEQERHRLEEAAARERGSEVRTLVEEYAALEERRGVLLRVLFSTLCDHPGGKVVRFGDPMTGAVWTNCWPTSNDPHERELLMRRHVLSMAQPITSIDVAGMVVL